MSVMPSLQKFIKNKDGSYTVIKKNEPYGKITGTQISGLLKMNPWQTPFGTAVRIMRLYNEYISDKPSVYAGTVIEPKILDYIGAVHGDDVFGKRKGDHETWASDFEDPIFGGHIDGLMPDGTVVEIKTSSRPQDWDGKIPVHYHMQASLYAHFLGTKDIIFGVGFTDRKTIADPEKWVPTKDNTLILKTGIMDGFDKIMEDAKTFYERTVLLDRTPVPDMSNEGDREIVRYLDAQLWEDDELQNQLAKIQKLMDCMAEYKVCESRLESAKTELALYMDYNGVSEVESDKMTFSRDQYTRNSVDINQLKNDGLYDLYLKEKIYKTLTIKERK